MSEVQTIKEVMPTDKPELVIKMSDEQFRIVGYEDLLKHKIFIPPREWKSFVFDAEKIQFKNGILLDLPFILANAPMTEASALQHCALTIAEKQEGTYESEYDCVIKLYFFSENLITISESFGFKGESGGSLSFTLQALREDDQWRSIFIKAACRWAIPIIDDKNITREEIVAAIVNKVVERANE